MGLNLVTASFMSDAEVPAAPPRRSALFLEQACLFAVDESRDREDSPRSVAMQLAELRAFDGALVLLGVPGHQPGRGRRSPEALQRLRASALLADAGLSLSASYWCPHELPAPDSPRGLACLCRQPMPGLLQRAASDLGLRLAQSWLVGGGLDSIEAGRRAGCRTILVSGMETEWRQGPKRAPHFIVRDLGEAAQVIGEA